MIERLLIPLETGPLGERTFVSGIELARQLNAVLIGLVVEPFSTAPRSDRDLQKHARGLLAPLARRAAESGVSFRSVITQASDVAEAIVAEANEQHADLILMGTHGRTRLGEFLKGANTRKVMSLTDVPVMVLRLAQPAKTQLSTVDSQLSQLAALR